MGRLRDRSADGLGPEGQRLRRKADQEWDAAGDARQAGDREAEARHTEKAREYESQLRDLRMAL